MMHGQRTARRSPVVRALTAVMAISLLVGACGGNDGDDGGGGDDAVSRPGQATDETGLEDAGEPVRGGRIAYGLEAETSGGYCLAEGQLAISGIQVARAMFDTLTVMDEDGKYVPYLAKSVTNSPDYKTWTIGLRDGVKFHDGSALDATVVKNNLDAYRGQYPARKPLLFLFVLSNIDTVTVKDPMTVEVTMKKPWVAFPAYLFSQGRLGMMAQAQLDDAETCDTKPIGTGPFKFESWRVNDVLVAKRNPDYWQMAPDGKPYPYVDEVNFRPIPDADQRLNALQSGEIDAMHTSNADIIGGELKRLQSDGTLNTYVTQKFAEVGYLMLNASKPPFDDERMRRAMALGGDREKYNQIINKGLPTPANGPFAPGSAGYVEDTGFPKYNPTEAKKLVDEYVRGGGKPEFTLFSSNTPDTQRYAELIKEDSKAIGITVNIVPEEQAKLINDAIGGTFNAITWRNHPGGDPDTQYVWWYDGDPSPTASANPVNFGRINDPVIDQLLDQGRSEIDPAARERVYQDLNKRFAEKIWNVWDTYSVWAVGEKKNVHGVLGPKLPDGANPNPGLSTTGHTMIGMWVAD